MTPKVPESVEFRGERELIRRIAARLGWGAPSGAVPFGDDMAAVQSGSDLLWTTDMLMDGVDFDSAKHSWRQIGQKALAVNLSDCAAMAVRPVSALAAVALCDRLTMADAEELLNGILDCAKTYDCPLVGGDTNSWVSPTVISVAVAAAPPPGRRPILRSGAKPGDRLFVSGKLGGSILGRHLAPVPRIDLALRLAELGPPTAMIDISDGLSVDLGHICDSSSCGAVLDAALLETATHPDAHALARTTGKNAFDHALHDGEDFELLVALPPSCAERVAGDIGLLALGEFVAEPGIWLREPAGATARIERGGWEHFR